MYRLRQEQTYVGEFAGETRHIPLLFRELGQNNGVSNVSQKLTAN